jgi:hypothetical protein
MKRIYVTSLLHHRDDQRDTGVYGAYSSLQNAEKALPKLFDEDEVVIDIDAWNGCSKLVYTNSSTWLIEEVEFDGI